MFDSQTNGFHEPVLCNDLKTLMEQCQTGCGLNQTHLGHYDDKIKWEVNPTHKPLLNNHLHGFDSSSNTRCQNVYKFKCTVALGESVWQLHKYK